MVESSESAGVLQKGAILAPLLQLGTADPRLGQVTARLKLLDTATATVACYIPDPTHLAARK